MSQVERPAVALGGLLRYGAAGYALYELHKRESI